MKVKIAIFASGGGTNAENLAQYFRNNDIAEISIMVTNVVNAGIVERSKRLGIPCHYLPNDTLSSGPALVTFLKTHQIDFIVLAGYLRKIPEQLVQTYQGRILNIHPALLPDYGGKGMYGMNVHKAVVEAGEKYSGITVHEVNEKYDEGSIVFQKSYPLKTEETPESLAMEILKLEHRYFPQVVEKYIRENIT